MTSVVATVSEVVEQNRSAGVFGAIGDGLGKLARQLFRSAEERFVDRVEKQLDERYLVSRTLGVAESRACMSSFEYLSQLSDERVRNHSKLEHRIIQQLLAWQGKEGEHFMALPSIARTESLTARQRDDMATQILELYRSKVITGTGVSVPEEAIRNAQVNHLSETLYVLARRGVSESVLTNIVGATVVEPHSTSFFNALIAEREAGTPVALKEHLQTGMMKALSHPEAAKIEWCRGESLISAWMESHHEVKPEDGFIKDLNLARSHTPGGIVPLKWWVAAKQALALERPSEMLPELLLALKEAALLIPVRGTVGSSSDLKTLRAVVEAFPGNEQIQSAVSLLAEGNVAQSPFSHFPRSS